LRVGDLALRHDRLAEAEYAFRTGLSVFPSDYRLLAAQARLAVARGRWRDAIAYGDQAIATVPDPATFGVVSDAYAALGDSAHAALPRALAPGTDDPLLLRHAAAIGR